MKKSLFVLFSLLFVAGISFGQKAPASPPMTSESSMVTVNYSAPSKKGRDVFGALVPYGKVWRTGANDATTITFKKDVNFGGARVKAGTYSLFTIPGEKEWSVILNSEAKQWGAYKYDEKKNVAEVKVKSMVGESNVEQMNITTSDSQVTISWDMTVVHIPLKF
ncbi:Protein of unknown function [Spirosomataceae bacterium TFI 002]|nr:Protein of unknown function [Spirosomataceae bacterium TFI 002]